jgi:alpha-tubulin suppressor-like RCC1 family protein
MSFRDIYDMPLGIGHKVFIKGSNVFGQCTNSKLRTTQTKWLRLENLFTSIKHISCGHYHVIVLTGTVQRCTNSKKITHFMDAGIILITNSATNVRTMARTQPLKN